MQSKEDGNVVPVSKPMLKVKNRRARNNALVSPYVADRGSVVPGQASQDLEAGANGKMPKRLPGLVQEMEIMKEDFYKKMEQLASNKAKPKQDTNDDEGTELEQKMADKKDEMLEDSWRVPVVESTLKHHDFTRERVELLEDPEIVKHIMKCFNE